MNIYFWAQLFFELDKGDTCLCVQQQLVTRAYYIISRIINQFLLLVLLLSLLCGVWELLRHKLPHNFPLTRVRALPLFKHHEASTRFSYSKLHLAKQAAHGDSSQSHQLLAYMLPLFFVVSYA